jgi:hypothetical protein
MTVEEYALATLRMLLKQCEGGEIYADLKEVRDLVPRLVEAWPSLEGHPDSCCKTAVAKRALLHKLAEAISEVVFAPQLMSAASFEADCAALVRPS